VLALLAALFSAASATAASPGIGTSVVGTTIAQLDLGDLVSARILGDDSIATIDKGVLAVPEAATVLRPLTVTSGVLPALNKSIAPVETRSTGTEKKTDYSTDLGNALLPQLVDGSLTPATLSAIVDSAGARAGLVNSLTDLVLGGGLLSVDSVTANLGADAAKESSTSTRGVDVGAISGLNLGALLAGLGLPLNALSLPDVEALTEELGLLGAGNPVAGLLTSLGIAGTVPTDAAGLDGVITGLNGRIASSTAALTSLANVAIVPVCDNIVPLGAAFALIPQLAALNLGLTNASTCQAAVAAVTAALAADRLDVGGLLSGLLTMLDGLELLNISGIDVGLTSKATDAVGTSVAKVTAAIGSLKVGNLAAVPGVDLASTPAQVLDTVDDVTANLDSVLGVVGLDGIVNLALLDTTGTGVTKTPTGYVRSVSQLTGVDLSIVPPSDLASLISGLPLPAASVGGLLAAIPGLPGGVAAPALPGTVGMEALNTLLTGAVPVDALAGGARLRLASVGGVAEFLPQAAGTTTPPGGTLPRTGGTSDVTAFAVAAVIMAMLGLGIRRRVLAPVRVD
jgi:LPXTG-motif cell wall-anchored protein